MVPVALVQMRLVNESGLLTTKFENVPVVAKKLVAVALVNVPLVAAKLVAVAEARTAPPLTVKSEIVVVAKLLVPAKTAGPIKYSAVPVAEVNARLFIVPAVDEKFVADKLVDVALLAKGLTTCEAVA